MDKKSKNITPNIGLAGLSGGAVAFFQYLYSGTANWITALVGLSAFIVFAIIFILPRYWKHRENMINSTSNVQAQTFQVQVVAHEGKDETNTIAQADVKIISGTFNRTQVTDNEGSTFFDIPPDKKGKSFTISASKENYEKSKGKKFQIENNDEPIFIGLKKK